MEYIQLPPENLEREPSAALSPVIRTRMWPLLSRCIADRKAARKHRLCVISSAKKQPFLSDAKYLAYKVNEIEEIPRSGGEKMKSRRGRSV